MNRGWPLLSIASFLSLGCVVLWLANGCFNHSEKRSALFTVPANAYSMEVPGQGF